MARAAGDDQRVPVAEARPERREVDALDQQAALRPQVLQGVLCELRQRLGDPPALLGQGALELAFLPCPAPGEARPVPEDAGAAHGQLLTLGDIVEQLRARDVDQRHAAADEQQRPDVRKAPGERLRHVDDDADAGLEQLLGGDPVEIGVVDDRDIVLAEPMHEALGPAVESCRPGELDQASHGLPPQRWPGTRVRRASAPAPPSARPGRAPRSACGSGRRGPSRRGSAGRPGSRSAAGG